VGSNGWEGVSNLADEDLGPCIRCLKAKATCINSLAKQQKTLTSEALEPLSSSSVSGLASERVPLQHTFQLNSALSQRSDRLSNGTRTSSSSEGRTENVTSLRFNSTAIQTPRTDFTNPFEGPSKRRMIERSLGSPTTRTYQHHENSGGTNMLDSRSMYPSDTDGNSGSRPNKMFPVDNFDFSMGVDTNHDNQNNMVNLLLSQDQDTATFSNKILGEINPETLEAPALQPLETKDDCLNRLSDLSAGLLKDFSQAHLAKLPDILSISSTAPKNTIGRVLERSQVFLEILQLLKKLSYCNSDARDGSECSYSEDWDGNEFISISSNDLFHHNSMDLTPGDSSRPSAGETGISKESAPLTVDMPTTLMILTCYTWLLQIYDIIFSLIYTSLSAQLRTSTQLIPTILPGLLIGGFDLDDHKDLQLEILIQVSSKRLELIEETLGISVTSKTGDAMDDMPDGKGILDTASASALLSVIFKQNGLGASKHGKGKAVSVKQTMDNIRHIIKGGGS
jgi:hypothetical protein